MVSVLYRQQRQYITQLWNHCKWLGAKIVHKKPSSILCHHSSSNSQNNFTSFYHQRPTLCRTPTYRTTLQTVETRDQLYLGENMAAYNENSLRAALTEASKVLLETDILMNTATTEALHVSLNLLSLNVFSLFSCL